MLAAMTIAPTPWAPSRRNSMTASTPRARIGILGKFFGDGNYALIYDFGGSSDGFGGTGAPARSHRSRTSVSCRAAPPPESRTPISAIPASSRSAANWRSKAASWTCPTRSTNRPVRTTSCSWSGPLPALSRRISPPATSAPPPARAGTPTGSGSALMRPARPPARSTRHRASIPTAPTHRAGWRHRPRGGPGRRRQRLLSSISAARSEWLIRAPAHQVTGAQTLTLSDRPELRIDPTTLISTGALAGVSGAQVYSVEAAGTYGPLFAQGEYFWYNVDRNNLPAPLPSTKFEGGYVQASYVLTGETASTMRVPRLMAASSRTTRFFDRQGLGRMGNQRRGQHDEPERPVGHRQRRRRRYVRLVYTAALNWYMNRNVRFMFLFF